jgi:signal transduction histidine kinase
MNLDEIRQITENASGGVTEDSQHLLAELRAAAEDALIDIRDISTSLVRGPNEDEFRQSLSLEARIAAHERRTGLPVGRVGLQCLQDIPEQIVEVVIQVVREALTNGHKHARGSAQSVIAQREGNFLLVKVVDGGLARGRVSQEPPFPGGGGLGLSGMRYRAESIGGSMEVVREEGKGATISFKFPLPGTTGGDAEET